MKEKAKEIVNIRVEPWIRRILKHDARTRKLTVSKYTLSVIKRGLGIDQKQEGQRQ